MSIEKMSLVQINGGMNALDETLLRCLDAGNFHPEQLSSLSGRVQGFTQVTAENPYKSILSSITGIAETSGITLTREAVCNENMSREDIEEFVEKFRDKISGLLEEKKKLQASIEQNTAAISQIDHLKNLNASLDDIFACKYIEVRFGRLPSDSYPKLSYYNDRMFIFIDLSEADGYHWGVYFTTADDKVEVDDIFLSLYFERIWIPDYVHGTPQTAQENINTNIEKAKAKLKEINAAITYVAKSNAEAINKIYNRVYFLEESYDMRKYAMAYKNSFHIVGFIPKKSERSFKSHFDGIKSLEVDFKPPDSDNRLQIPTKLKNNRLFKPFEMFVDMYGMPSYSDIDPTPFVAITYMLLFGIMFGDLGQGLVISLVGFLLWKLKNMADFGRILIRIGFTSAIFGLVYGSVFGLENLLDPLYKTVLGLEHKPIEVLNPTTINGLLIAAIGLGVVLIIISMLLNMFTGIKNKDYEKAFFSSSGLAGLLFYGSVLIGAVSSLAGGKSLFTAPYILCFIVLPLIVMFLKHPLGTLLKRGGGFKFEGGFGSFMLEGIFELFEVFLSFITNTMSFLRVGGFIISHAGMMAVVLLLTEMMAGSGSIAVLIFGNLFVMALEGFIVGIQVLRLEFYELFSRYFEGQGKAFIAVENR